MATRARLRRKAQAIAGAQYVPQRQQIKTDSRQQQASLASEGTALQQSLGAARRAVRNIGGLTGRDRRMTMKDLAYRSADVGGSIALQQSQVRQDAHQSLVDLAQSEGADVASQFADLLQQRQEHRQGERDFARHQALEGQAALQQHIATAKWDAAHPKLSGSGGGSAGRTQSKIRSDHRQAQNAAFQAEQLYKAAMKNAGKPKLDTKGNPVTDNNGKVQRYPGLPTTSQGWNQFWAGLTAGVVNTSGVTDASFAHAAVQRLRHHVQGGPPTFLGATLAGPLPQRKPAPHRKPQQRRR